MARAEHRRCDFQIGGERVPPGARRTVDLPVALLANHVPVTLPVQVVHGRRNGPTVFLSAAIHGDEILGVEIVRRVLAAPALARLAGTLLAVPIVNAFGFIQHSRYLPDRRDLNRCFPGSANGSLGAQLANLFMTEIVRPSQYGIDLHSAAIHRSNLPQIRADLGDAETRELAIAFGAPVVLHADVRDGSLRQAARDAGTKVLLYEAGEALRFDALAIRAGVRGVLRVLHWLGMVRRKLSADTGATPVQAGSSYWVRAPIGGILRPDWQPGDTVERGQRLAVVADPFGEVEVDVCARDGGLVIGETRLPVVNRGDALVHLARPAEAGAGPVSVRALAEDLDADPLLDEAVLP
ncbi:MAG TPA: succinylglutamate desuccinylase/aspartoacylase family protein [Xanthomonadaceae bacterium]|nr:succinylglutamate desuccinylase/aspartoacylase family protein [Xanthomonadaceae bacterium]